MGPEVNLIDELMNGEALVKPDVVIGKVKIVDQTPLVNPKTSGFNPNIVFRRGNILDANNLLEARKTLREREDDYKRLGFIVMVAARAINCNPMDGDHDNTQQNNVFSNRGISSIQSSQPNISNIAEFRKNKEHDHCEHGKEKRDCSQCKAVA